MHFWRITVWFFFVSSTLVLMHAHANHKAADCHLGSCFWAHVVVAAGCVWFEIVALCLGSDWVDSYDEQLDRSLYYNILYYI